MEQQTLPHFSSPPATAQDAARPIAMLKEVLPWPLQAEAQNARPSSSQAPAAEEGTPDASPLTIDRPRNHQPQLPAQSSVPLCDGVAPGKSEHLSDQGLKICAQQLPARQKPAKEDVVGREMYITASFLNHSCEPNCIKHRLLGQQSGIATVTALRDIKASQGSL